MYEPFRMNEPQHNDQERGVRDAPRKKRAQNKTPPDSQDDLGATSDETGMKFEPDVDSELSAGDEVKRSTSDVSGLGPPGGGRIERGFSDDIERRD